MLTSLTPRRRLLAAVSLIACAATAFSFTARDEAGAALGDCTPEASWGSERADLAGQVVTLVNQHRSGIGLVSLQVSPSLTKVAVWKARHMAAYSYMSHEDPAPPIARTTGQRFADCGYPTSAGWGENIAYGYGTASAVMDGWLNSSGHRANIERSSFRAIGVGAAASGSGTIYWAQAFGTSTFDVGGGGGGPTLPTVNLTSAPASSTTSTSASFGWSTTGSPTSTTCSLDGAAAAACTSPRSYSGLGVGSHSFRVTVANSAGSATAQHTWSVTSSGGGTTAPTVAITSAPAASTTATGASFSWSATGSPTATTCSLDGAIAVACTSPRSYSGLAVGSHTFRVTVSNSAGSASAQHTWSVTSSGGGGTGAPTVTITQAPARVGSSTTATFGWTTTGAVTSTTCSLDNGVAKPCSSPITYTGLSRTSHSFKVTVSGPSGSRFKTVSWRIT